MSKQEQIIESKQRISEASIIVTEGALKSLKMLWSLIIRKTISYNVCEGGGCSGMTYKMDFDKQQKEFDKVFKSNGLTVICDLKSWLYLKDVEIDYSDDLLNGGFKIKNPNAERTCGCGTSFSA